MVLCLVTFTDLQTRRAGLSASAELLVYLRDAVSVVLATATCLAGWLAGCPSHAGIASKRLNLAENFFYLLKAPSP